MVTESDRSKGSVRLAAVRGTQVEKAKRIGVTQQAVSDWESGKAVPNYANRKAMRREYGIPVDWWDEPADPPVRRAAGA